MSQAEPSPVTYGAPLDCAQRVKGTVPLTTLSGKWQNSKL